MHEFKYLTGKLNFNRSHGDPCFLWKNTKDKFVCVLIYVDDCAVFGDKSEVEKFQSNLSERFSIKKLGVLNE